MGDSRQGGRRGKRLLERLFGPAFNTGWGAAEGLLGVVAMVLVVWLLWPEDRGPALDKQAEWEQSVRAAEQRLERQQAERALGNVKTSEDRAAPSSHGDAGPGASRSIEAAAAPERRRIAKLSELADPLDEFGRRQGDLSASGSFRPAPAKPTPSTSPERDLSETDVASIDDQTSLSPSGAEAVDYAAQPQSDPEAPAISLSTESADLEIATLSGGVIDFAPLPEVDLSDLDTLVPSALETSPTVETPSVDKPSGADGRVKTAALIQDPPEVSEVEPFIVDGERPPDVTRRPRDDAPTWLRNAVAANWTADQPIIAVVIDDLGLNRSNTAALNDLPAPLTLAFLPYAGRIEAQTEAARAAGHELMLHLPMEPLGPQWPGPNALTTKLSRDEFESRLKTNLDRFEGFVGINNHMGSRLTADRSRMEIVMRELRERDVLFLDSKTNPRSVASDTAGLNGVPNTDRDVFIDHVIDFDTIQRQLRRTEQVALRDGSAVAIGHPHDATIRALESWLPSLEARGITLVPISAVVARRACDKGMLIALDTCGQFLQAKTPEAPTAASQGG